MNNAKKQKNSIVLSISCAIAISVCQAGCLNYQNKWSTGGLGLQLAQVEDGVVIKDIAPTFSNADAALKTGDYIVSVDGTDVSNLPKEAIADLITGPVGGLVTITVLRNGELVSFEIERIIQKDAPRRTLHSVKLGTPVMSAPAATPAPAEAPQKAPAAPATASASEENAIGDAEADSTPMATATDTADGTDTVSQQAAPATVIPADKDAAPAEKKAAPAVNTTAPAAAEPATSVAGDTAKDAGTKDTRVED